MPVTGRIAGRAWAAISGSIQFANVCSLSRQPDRNPQARPVVEKLDRGTLEIDDGGDSAEAKPAARSGAAVLKLVEPPKDLGAFLLGDAPPAP